MGKRIHILFVLGAMVASLTLGSCARKIPFNNQARKDYRLSESEIKGLQFYTSSDIILERAEKQKNEKGTNSEGTLVISEESNMERVNIPAGTMGVCVKVYPDNKVAVSFGSDDEYLIFGDPNNVGRYSLFAKDWKNGKGKVNYGGKVYYALPPSGSAYLLFKTKKIKKKQKKVNTVKGRKV